jgi:hypothetical protein
VNQLAPGTFQVRQAGICSLKGFGGFHRVYALPRRDERVPQEPPRARGEGVPGD